MFPPISYKTLASHIYIVLISLKVVFLKDIEQQRRIDRKTDDVNKVTVNATQQAIDKEEKSNAAITIILALYGVFVVALIIFHCWLNRSEDMKNEKSRDEKEKADFDKSHAEARKRKMREIKEEKGSRSTDSQDVVHFEHAV